VRREIDRVVSENLADLLACQDVTQKEPGQGIEAQRWFFHPDLPTYAFISYIILFACIFNI
jgi:hypothetical protein